VAAGTLAKYTLPNPVLKADSMHLGSAAGYGLSSAFQTDGANAWLDKNKKCLVN